MIYKYRAISDDGQSIEGFYKASCEMEVLNMLKNNNFLPVLVEKDKNHQYKMNLFKLKIKKKDLSIFCRQFYTMTNAGMEVVPSLKILKDQTKNKLLKESIQSIYENIQKGYTISQALEIEKVFPLILVSMVEAGEVSGNLDVILERMAIHYENETKLENKIKSAMIYPIVLAISSIIVVIFMLIAVLPTFVNMFSDSGILLPWSTRLILNLSHHIRTYWYIILGILMLFGFLIYYYKNTKIGERKIDSLKIKIPYIKRIHIKIITSRFTRTLSTLLSSGIPLLDSLNIVSKILNNKEIQERFTIEIDSIRKGVPLSIAMRNIGIFPSMVDAMINIGEESGSLDETLDKTASFYDEEVENSLEKITNLIEPLLLIIMAIIIGFIVISMALPMFDMINII